MAKNYYLILGLNAGASDEEIKSAYRRKAKELHPDAGGKADEFLDVQESYHVLTNRSLRASYDDELRQGSGTWVRAHFADFHEPIRNEPVRDLSISHSFSAFEPSFDELFDRLWSNFTLLERPKAERIEDLNVEILLSPEEAQHGGKVRLMVPAQIECPVCEGEGRMGQYKCWRCSGEGHITDEFPVGVEYPPMLRKDHVVRVALDHLGIENFCLTARFRKTGERS